MYKDERGQNWLSTLFLMPLHDHITVHTWHVVVHLPVNIANIVELSCSYWNGHLELFIFLYKSAHAMEWWQSSNVFPNYKTCETFCSWCNVFLMLLSGYWCFPGWNFTHCSLLPSLTQSSLLFQNITVCFPVWTRFHCYLYCLLVECLWTLDCGCL